MKKKIGLFGFLPKSRKTGFQLISDSRVEVRLEKKERRSPQSQFFGVVEIRHELLKIGSFTQKCAFAVWEEGLSSGHRQKSAAHQPGRRQQFEVLWH